MLNIAIQSAARFKLSEQAQRTMQQHGIPRMVTEYLLRYGKTVPDGQGGRILFFDQAALERLMSDEGKEGILKLHRYFDTYLVKDKTGLVTAVSTYDRRALLRKQAA